MIDLTINHNTLERNIAFCKEKKIVLPTFAVMKSPQRIPAAIKKQLKHTGLWDLHPANLFRISWKNEPKEFGGLFGGPNHFVLTPELTGCRANIVMMSGRWFPTGAHKVGAAFACLAPALVTGQFDPHKTKAVWPSTGNYCRGGAYISALLGCHAVAILPEEMSKERFEWLGKIAGQVIATPGCESNVKEIFDKCRELSNSGEELQIFNQFDALGNPLWHYTVTGSAIEEVLNGYLTDGKQLAGYVAASGSGGTLAAGYYLKKQYPKSKLAVAEALQCPTLLQNGFGGHRIEGIGDKHVPWIHNVKNTDAVAAIDDEQTLRILRLFNDPEGHKWLTKLGVKQEDINKLPYLGISSICNLLSAIKLAKYFEYNEDDIVFTVFTDSVDLYNSRLNEMYSNWGKYSERQAEVDWTSIFKHQSTDYFKELSYSDKKAIHNLKYFTWVEQQGKTVEELNAQWYNENYWKERFSVVPKWDEMIKDFNAKVGLRFNFL